MATQSNLYLCRLCLQKTPTKVYIYSGDFPKMVEMLTSVRFREGDGLPKFSCTKCVLEVKQALMIRKRILTTHKTLLECLQKKRKAALLRKPIVKNVVTQSNVQSRKTDSPVVKRENIKAAKTGNPIIVIKVRHTDVNESISDDSNSTDKIEKVEDKKSTQEEIKVVNVQTKNKLYHCKICNITFTDRRLAVNHNNKHKKSKCTICDKVITTSNLKKHIIRHSENPVDCKICGTTCKNTESLRGHMFYQHKCTPDTFVCEECGKKFRTRCRFQLHKKKAHMGLRNFKCETCGKCFFTNANLNTHINMTHKKLRPHICEFCGNGYSSVYALKTHKRQHTNEKPFTCKYCSEGFRQKVSLRSHLKSKHGYEEVQEFFCDKCGRGFATSYALSIHERLHLSEKCNYCSESFAESDYLEKHLRDVHNVES